MTRAAGKRSWLAIAGVFVAVGATWAYRKIAPDKRSVGQIRQAEKARQSGIRRELRGLAKESA